MMINLAAYESYVSSDFNLACKTCSKNSNPQNNNNALLNGYY